MGFLRTDYSDVKGGFEPLPIGEYECIISEVTMGKSQAGNEMLKITMTVRDDVDQDGKKRKFFDNVPVMDSMMWKFQALAKAANLPQGQDFGSAAEFAKAIQYATVRIKNKHEEYNGSISDRVAFYNLSKFGGNAGAQDQGSGNPFANDGKPIDISDDDLPF